MLVILGAEPAPITCRGHLRETVPLVTQGAHLVMKHDVERGSENLRPRFLHVCVLVQAENGCAHLCAWHMLRYVGYMISRFCSCRSSGIVDVSHFLV